MNKIIVITPHPDDETLGAGGSLLKMKSEGKELIWLIVTNVRTEYGYTMRKVLERNGEIQEVAARYGFSEVKNLELWPAGLDKYYDNELINKISEVVHDIKPDTLIIPNVNDIHTDHLKVYNACIPFIKSFRYPFVKKILSMEVLSETGIKPNDCFIPNYFIDITNFIMKKIDIMKIYKSEIGIAPFPRSIETIQAQALLRGMLCGVTYAEAFHILKWID